MALKSTIYKVALQIADMDRGVYADHTLTLALHPSETEERLMVRVLAFALLAPASAEDGGLLFARGLSDTEEPDLWQHDLTGQLMQWVEVGQPEERRMTKACGRVGRGGKVSIYCYASSAAIWWAGVVNKVSRMSNLHVWQFPAEQTRELAAMAQRAMQLQVTVQDGAIWVGNGQSSVEVQPQRLFGAP